MTYPTTERCDCLQCPGQACNCGCQNATSATPMNQSSAAASAAPAAPARRQGKAAFAASKRVRASPRRLSRANAPALP